MQRILFILFPIIMLLSNCSQDDSSIFLCKIEMPENNDEIAIDEHIIIDYNLNPGSNISEVDLYLNNKLIETNTSEIKKFIIDQAKLEIGKSELKIVAHLPSGVIAEDKISLVIIGALNESPDRVSFEDGIPKSWYSSSWEINTSHTNEGISSVSPIGAGGSIIASKTYNIEGNISFRIKNDGGELFFFMDGDLIAEWFGFDDWYTYSYYVSPGPHTFRWKSKTNVIKMTDVALHEGSKKHSVGGYFEGGVIFYVDSTGQHGLICTKEDFTIGDQNLFEWGCSSVVFSKDSNILSWDNGQFNTDLILSVCDDVYSAAYLCDNFLVLDNGIEYDDWFLPSFHQLKKMYLHREVIGDYYHINPLFYWSSQTYREGIADVINFFDGSYHGRLRKTPSRIRPIRRF